LIDTIISWFKADDSEKSQVRFGRYSDSFKSEKQVSFWNKANESFDKKEYLQSYEKFFKYLTDDHQKNVKVEKNGEDIHFEIFQGSKNIKGLANKDKFVAEANVATFDKLNVVIMRRLLEMNYSLRYSRYAINGNKICLKFDTSSLDSTPEKLYHALKEVATRSDKQDDLLLHEFSSLAPIDDSHVEKPNAQDQETKYAFLLKWISETLEIIENLDRNRFEGCISYLLLNLAYKIDYLLTPQGKLTDELEQLHHVFFTNFQTSKVERNNMMIKTLEKIVDRDKAKLLPEFYVVKATFGITSPTANKSVVQMLNEELKGIEWYKKNNQLQLVLNHLEYIAQYALFNYGLHSPSRSLFALVVELVNTDYLAAFGHKTLTGKSDKKLNAPLIQKRLKLIIANGKEKYKELSLNMSKLKYGSKTEFIESLYLEMIELKYDKIS